MKVRTAPAVAMLLASCGLAVAQTAPGETQRAPSATQPAPSTTQPQGTTGPGSSAQPQWYTHQEGEMRASKIVGSTVKNSAGETIGDVNEIVLAKDGQVSAVIIGVGGFLGLGEREVAVSFKSLRTTQDGVRTVLTLDADKETLRAAPEWRWSENRTTGPGGVAR